MTHQCPICPRHFEFASKLQRHQLTHSGWRPFSCHVCRKAFRQSAHLKGHLKIHSTLRDVSLVISEAIHSQVSCTSPEERYVHRVGPRVSEDGELVDQNTWYSSLQTSSEAESERQNRGAKELRRVEKIIRDNGRSSQKEQTHRDSVAKKQTWDFAQWNHKGFGDLPDEENLQNCRYSECTEILPNSSTKTEPSLEKRELTSSICSKEEAQMTNCSPIVEKMAKMTNRHQCAMCLKCFSAPSKLKRHMLIHTSQRPFSCEFCPKAFRQLAHLKIHLSTHFSQRQNKAKQTIPKSGVPQEQSRPQNTMNASVYLSKPSGKQWTEEPNEELKGLTENIHMVLFPKNVQRVEPDSLNIAENWTRSKVVHECPVCLKCFSAPSKLRRHCLIHTGQRPFQCSLCCHAFRQLSHLKAHYSVHAGSSLQLHKSISQPQPCTNQTSKARLKRFLCTSLGRKFRSAKHLTVHQQKQQELKISATLAIDKNIPETGTVKYSSNKVSRQGYSCTECSKCFNAPSKLRRHALIHTGQRPFRCLVCFRGFRQKSHLKAHRCKGGSRGTFQSTLSEGHLRDRSSKQDFDGSRTNMSISKDDVTDKEHFISNSMMVENTDNYVSSSSVGFASKYIPEDNGDLTSLSYRDISCENGTNTSCETSGLNTSARQTKECGYQCTICLKIFNFPSKLSRHLLIHMDIRPFKCTICSKSFRQLCHLQSHSKVHTVRKKMLCKGNYKCRIGTFIPETSEMLNETNNNRQESGNLPLEQKPDFDSMIMGSNNIQKPNLVNSSSHSRSSNVQEFTPNIECTTSPVEVQKENRAQNASIKRNANQCIFCLKTFDFPSKLSRHLLVHTGIRLYECHVCCKSFKQLSHLQCHQWVHNRKENPGIKANLLNQRPISSGCTTLSEEPDLHQERSEILAVENQGHDRYTEQVHHQKWVSEGNNCSPSGSDHADDEVKSETVFQRDKLVNPTLKHEADPSGADSTLRTMLCKGLDEQSSDPGPFAQKLKSNHFCVSEYCSNRSGEVDSSGADRTTRILVWDGMDQQELAESRDSGLFGQRIKTNNSHSVHFCIPEDFSNTSSTIHDSYRLELKHHHQGLLGFKGSEEEGSSEGHGKHLTEAPNDLPICPTCSQCFDSLKKLDAHKCPVHCPEQTLRKSYQCAVCFKSFEAPSKLKRHYVIHTGQRPFRCSLCEKDFTQSSHLKTHMMSHR